MFTTKISRIQVKVVRCIDHEHHDNPTTSILNHICFVLLIIKLFFYLYTKNQLDEWHRDLLLMEKNYTKDQKRSRADLKKHSTDTIRLKKKTKKCQSDMIQSLIETSMMTINNKHDALATLERTYLRDIMVEERNRFCVFVSMLQPIVKEGCNIMFELGHLQEAMDSISNITQNPKSLPATFENSILQLLSGSETQSVDRITNSIGSRKNSGSSLNSSASTDSREIIQTALNQRSRQVQMLNFNNYIIHIRFMDYCLQNSSTTINTPSWNLSDSSSLSNSHDLTPRISSSSGDGRNCNPVNQNVPLCLTNLPHRPPLPIVGSC